MRWRRIRPLAQPEACAAGLHLGVLRVLLLLLSMLCRPNRSGAACSLAPPSHGRWTTVCDTGFRVELRVRDEVPGVTFWIPSAFGVLHSPANAPGYTSTLPRGSPLTPSFHHARWWQRRWHLSWRWWGSSVHSRPPVSFPSASRTAEHVIAATPRRGPSRTHVKQAKGLTTWRSARRHRPTARLARRLFLEIATSPLMAATAMSAIPAAAVACHRLNQQHRGQDYLHHCAPTLRHLGRGGVSMWHPLTHNLRR